MQMTKSQWLLDVMGRFDFTMPSMAFDEIINRIELLSASKPVVAVPTGWRIRIFDDGAAVVEKDGLGGVVCKSSDESIASAILRELVGDILAASPAAPSPAQTERGAFEAWYRKEIHDAIMYRRDVKGSDRYGEYCQWFHEESWKAWQARAALQAAPAAETVTLTQQEFDAMRVALEVIAVGDSLTPTATAAHGLVASGFWTDTLESKAADAPGMAEPVAYVYEHATYPDDHARIVSFERKSHSEGFVCRPLVYEGEPQPSPTAVVLDDELALTVDARECLMDVVSHHHDFRTACLEVKASNETTRSDELYWQKQIDVLDRMKAQAERVLTAASPQPVEQTRALTDQEIYDKFDFLEGVVNETTYRQIARKAIEIARAAARPASGETE
jgi:hypothetical protein